MLKSQKAGFRSQRLLIWQPHAWPGQPPHGASPQGRVGGKHPGLPGQPLLRQPPRPSGALLRARHSDSDRHHALPSPQINHLLVGLVGFP